MASKKISFRVPDWMYEHIQGLLNIKNPSYRVDDLFKACAINRFIQIGYLDEFGQPVPILFFEPNNLNLPTWDDLNKTFSTETVSTDSVPRSSFSLKSIREVCNEK